MLRSSNDVRALSRSQEGGVSALSRSGRALSTRTERAEQEQEQRTPRPFVADDDGYDARVDGWFTQLWPLLECDEREIVLACLGFVRGLLSASLPHRSLLAGQGLVAPLLRLLVRHAPGSREVNEDDAMLTLALGCLGHVISLLAGAADSVAMKACTLLDKVRRVPRAP